MSVTTKNMTVRGQTTVGKAAFLKLYPNAAAAYSLRSLSDTYTGNAIRVRRSSDNAEQDIKFKDGSLDETQLTDFVGANSGYVTTWYDQSGNARNATQTTAASQPRIVNAGVVEKVNGKAACYFDGSNDTLNTSLNQLDYSPISCAASFGSVTKGKDFFGNRGFTNGGWIYRTLTGFYNIGLNSNVVFTSNNTSSHLIFVIRNISAVNSGWINSINAGTTNGSGYTNNNPSGVFSIGSDGNINGGINQSFGQGYIYEFVGWGTDQSTSRTAIESNINKYYQIY